MDDKCLDCTHVKRKKLYGIFLILSVMVLLAVAVIFRGGITGSWLEWERRTFTFYGTGLTGTGGTVDIRGTGSIGMSGWIIFQPGGAYNLTLWTKGSGTMTAIINGRKYSTAWKAIEKYNVDNYTCCFGYTRDWTTFRIKLTEPPAGLPEEMIVELTQSDKPASGNIIVSADAVHTLDGIAHTGQVFTGAGHVIIHQPGLR